jgi:hypothetical protein
MAAAMTSRPMRLSLSDAQTTSERPAVAANAKEPSTAEIMAELGTALDVNFNGCCCSHVGVRQRILCVFDLM